MVFNTYHSSIEKITELETKFAYICQTKCKVTLGCRSWRWSMETKLCNIMGSLENYVNDTVSGRICTGEHTNTDRGYTFLTTSIDTTQNPNPDTTPSTCKLIVVYWMVSIYRYFKFVVSQMLTAKLMMVLNILEKKARPNLGLNAKPGMCSLHIRTYMATWETATAAETQMAGLECGAIR